MIKNMWSEVVDSKIVKDIKEKINAFNASELIIQIKEKSEESFEKAKKIFHDLMPTKAEVKEAANDLKNKVEPSLEKIETAVKDEIAKVTADGVQEFELHQQDVQAPIGEL